VINKGLKQGKTVLLLREGVLGRLPTQKVLLGFSRDNSLEAEVPTCQRGEVSFSVAIEKIELCSHGGCKIF